MRAIYRAAADPPLPGAVEWALQLPAFGLLLRRAGLLSAQLPLSAAMAAAEEALEGRSSLLYRHFLAAIVRVAHARFAQLPRLDRRVQAALINHVLPLPASAGLDAVATQMASLEACPPPSSIPPRPAWATTPGPCSYRMADHAAAALCLVALSALRHNGLLRLCPSLLPPSAEAVLSKASAREPP